MTDAIKLSDSENSRLVLRIGEFCPIKAELEQFCAQVTNFRYLGNRGGSAGVSLNDSGTIKLANAENTNFVQESSRLVVIALTQSKSKFRSRACTPFAKSGNPTIVNLAPFPFCTDTGRSPMIYGTGMSLRHFFV